MRMNVPAKTTADGIHKVKTRGKTIPMRTTPTLKIQPREPHCKSLTASFAARPECFRVQRWIAIKKRLTMMRTAAKDKSPGKGENRITTALAPRRDCAKNRTGKSGLFQKGIEGEAERTKPG